MSVRDLIYTLYEIFSQGVTSEKVILNITPESEKLIENFISRWKKRRVEEDSLGIAFLYDYFCYSYDYWTENGKKPKLIPLSWTIGEPQLKRWDNRVESYQYLYSQGLLLNCKIPHLNTIKEKINNTSRETGLYLYEEYERQRFHNTDKGFVHCLLTISLCDERSKWCSSCKFKLECIDQLKKQDRTTALKRKFIKL